MKAFRIVELDASGRMKTLFHGIQGSRLIEAGKWYTADEKQVTDGSSKTSYISGFNVLKSREECEAYLERFDQSKRTLAIVPCEVREVRPKSHSKSNVFLARKLKVLVG